MKLACLMLAAGAGRRFGSQKQLADIDGTPMVQRALVQLQPLFDDRLYCVLGAGRETIARVVAPHARIIEHPDWAQGIGSSIACGIAAITRARAVDGILIALADQPALNRTHYRHLIAHFDGHHIVAAGYAGHSAVPALFPAAWFAELQQLQGDTGARHLLRCAPDQVITLAVPQAELDIDTPQDLTRLARARQPGARP